MSLQSTETIGKRLELLKELVPGMAPVAVLWYRAEPADWQPAQAAARARGWTLLSLEIRNVGEIAAALKTAMGAGAGALLVRDGGLLAYGTSLDALYARMAVYVDQLFRGKKPAELPVEQPKTFSVVLNLRTAKALGLSIPRSLLLRADEVIQ